MSILFSENLLQISKIRPLEADFTEVIGAIPLAPKMLYFYGKMPENRSKNVVKLTTEKMENAGEKLTKERGDLAEKIEKSCQDSEQKCAKKATYFSEKANSEMGLEEYSKVDSTLRKMEVGGMKVGERPKVVAIVGTRKPTAYGAKIAHDLAYEAAKRGVVVVSGLAYGIDSIAHRGALEAGGITVAVLGTPIDQIYPRAHRGLVEEIVAIGGCVMSEVPAGVEANEEYSPGRKYVPKTCFLERNRLIAGLADVVVIPEAAERSGSLNTAAHALEQGREVFVAPGDITRPMSRGCNRLIRQGATPYLEPADVLDLLFPPASKARGRRKRQGELQTELFGDTPAETAILVALGEGLEEGEEILRRTGLLAVDFNQSLTMLEVKGLIRGLGMNRWGLK